MNEGKGKFMKENKMMMSGERWSKGDEGEDNDGGDVMREERKGSG